MNTGEIILVIGALILFSVTAIFLNQAILDGDRTVTESRLTNGATAVALSYIENAKRLSFDEAVIADPDLNNPGMLTLPANLGPESGESPADFDDIDDFRQYTDSVKTNIVTYNVAITVAYIDTNTMSVSEHNQTYYKQMRVFVHTPFIPDTIKLAHIFTFWE
ncbi:hypothetical protein AMJ80_06485 [bacterium SM23_31]|nr:MAG: hypothetical protein AMJ80_06485 [bacterium SM23_31]